jgi:hypothetical protein
MSQGGKPLIRNKQLSSTPQLCMGIHVQDYASDEISKFMAIKSIFAAFFESAKYDHTPLDNIDTTITTHMTMLDQHNNTQVRAAVSGEISGSIGEQEVLEVDDCSQFSKRPCSAFPRPERSTKKCALDKSLLPGLLAMMQMFCLSQSQEIAQKLVQNHLLDIKSTKHMVLSCYIPEFGTLLSIFPLIYGYDFILYHMITYLCSRS